MAETTPMPTAPFIPHPLLRGGQLQTLAGQFFKPKGLLPPPIEDVVALPDGDRILLHLNLPKVPAPDRPAVLLMHGLGGDSESSYILRITAKLNAAGVAVARFNHRGCGVGGAHLARQIYHAGRIEDLEAALKHLAERWPMPLVIAAFSLSGNLLLRYLGEHADRLGHPSVKRAIAVCPPVDLELCSQALSARSNLHIDAYYTRRLIATARAKSALFPDDEPARFPRRMNLRRFDELYTAPRAGFPSRDAYYATSSAHRHTDKIKVPTLLLAAADDPIIPPVSFARASFSPAVRLRVERSGGHMGFISKGPTRYGDRRWMDEAVIDYALG
jgi:predicted alpha/beta-fold hydrolase